MPRIAYALADDLGVVAGPRFEEDRAAAEDESMLRLAGSQEHRRMKSHAKSDKSEAD